MGTFEPLEKPNKILECDLQRTANIPSLVSGNSPSSFMLQRLRQVLVTCTCRLLCFRSMPMISFGVFRGTMFFKVHFLQNIKPTFDSLM